MLTANFANLKNCWGINFIQPNTEIVPSPLGSPGKPSYDLFPSQLVETSILGKQVIKKITCENGKFIIVPSKT